MFLLVRYKNMFWFLISESNSESDVESSDSIYHSVYEKSQYKRQVAAVVQDRTSTLSFEIEIDQGIFTMYTPVRVRLHTF